MLWKDFRFYCQKVLPLVYDDSLSYYELLCKVTKYINDLAKTTNVIEDDIKRIKEYIESVLPNGKYVDTNSFIPQTYFGDHIITDGTYPGCCIKNNDVFYLICDTQYPSKSSTGKVIAYDCTRDGNYKLWEKSVPNLYHANSVCYNSDGGFYAVAPSDDTYFISLYDKNWNYIGKLDTPGFVPFGVSYDHINNKAYWMAKRGGMIHYGTFTATQFEYIGTFDIKLPSEYIGSNPLQDFAVNDGKFYISSPYGYIAIGFIDDGITRAYRTLDNYDYANYRRLGELEGWEFDEFGDLYAAHAVYIQGAGSNRNANSIIDFTVTCVATNELSQRPIMTFEETDFTFNFTDRTAAKFRTWITELKHPAQLNLFEDTTRVKKLNFDYHNDIGFWVVDQPLVIDVKYLDFTQLYVRQPITLIATSDNAVMGMHKDNYQIDLQPGASFEISGEKYINLITTRITPEGQVDSPTNIEIGCGYIRPLIKMVKLPRNASAFKVDDVDYTSDPYGYYMGRDKLSFTVPED